MKIIGKASRDEFILLASDSELFKIAGFSSRYSKEAEQLEPLEVGKEIHVHELWGIIAKIRDSGEARERAAAAVAALGDVTKAVDAILGEYLSKIEAAKNALTK
jgi:hypothetical protein